MTLNFGCLRQVQRAFSHDHCQMTTQIIQISNSGIRTPSFKFCLSFKKNCYGLDISEMSLRFPGFLKEKIHKFLTSCKVIFASGMMG